MRRIDYDKLEADAHKGQLPEPPELAFAKLKALIRRVAARTYHDLLRAVGHVCDLFTEKDCFNFFKAAGYKNKSAQHARVAGASAREDVIGGYGERDAVLAGVSRCARKGAEGRQKTASNELL